MSSRAKSSSPAVGPREGSLSSRLPILKDVSHFGGFRERGGEKDLSAAASQASLQSGSVALWLANPGGTLSSRPLGPSRTNAEGHLCSESVTALEVSGRAGNSVFIFLSRFGLKKHQSVQERTQKFSWRAGLTRPAPGMECSLWGCWVRADTPFICCPRRSHWEETHPGLSHHTPREAGLAARGVTGLAGLIPDASVLERSVHHGPSDPPRSSLRQEMTESHAEVPAHSRGALLGCSNEAPILRPATLLLPICWYTNVPKDRQKGSFSNSNPLPHQKLSKLSISLPLLGHWKMLVSETEKGVTTARVKYTPTHFKPGGYKINVSIGVVGAEH